MPICYFIFVIASLCRRPKQTVQLCLSNDNTIREKKIIFAFMIFFQYFIVNVLEFFRLESQEKKK